MENSPIFWSTPWAQRCEIRTTAISIFLGMGLIGLLLFLVAVANAYRVARIVYVQGGEDAQGALYLAALLSGWLVLL